MSKTKFIIFGQSRSGSTLLLELIRSHPDITCENEIFNHLKLFPRFKLLSNAISLFPMPYLKYRVRKSDASIYGFKLLFFQVQNPEKLLSQLHHNNWKFVHIHRDNIWQVVLSNIIAMETNHWHSYSENESAPKSIKIKPGRLLKALEIRTNWKIEENKLIEPYDHISINYEKDLKNSNNWQTTADKIFDFLGIESHPVTSTIKPTYQKPYSELIENYHELTELVKNCEYAYLIND